MAASARSLRGSRRVHRRTHRQDEHVLSKFAVRGTILLTLFLGGAALWAFLSDRDENPHPSSEGPISPSPDNTGAVAQGSDLAETRHESLEQDGGTESSRVDQRDYTVRGEVVSLAGMSMDGARVFLSTAIGRPRESFSPTLFESSQ